MIKVGVYGDSFTACGIVNLRWPTLLEKDYAVQNYGAPATGVEWSVLNFDQTHQLYDKIIFVVTQPERLYIPNHPAVHHWTVHNESTEKIEKLPNKEKKHFQQFINFYVRYMIDHTALQLKQKTLINYVKTTRPDALLIPAYQNTVPNSNYLPLIDISLLDVKNNRFSRYIDDAQKKYGGDMRPCHMNPTNNYILYKKIKQWIETGDFRLDDINDFFIPTTTDDLFLLDKKTIQA